MFVVLFPLLLGGLNRSSPDVFKLAFFNLVKGSFRVETN
jgi:hypothetical protein